MSKRLRYITLFILPLLVSGGCNRKAKKDAPKDEGPKKPVVLV